MNVLTFLQLGLILFQLHIVVSQFEFYRFNARLSSLPHFSSNHDAKKAEESVASEFCLIDIKTGLRKADGNESVKEPLFLRYSKNTYELMIPDQNGYLQFKYGESALITCTFDQKPNHLTLNNETSATISCLSDNSFKINNRKYVVPDFTECSAQIDGNVLNSNRRCGESGVLISIGFQLTKERRFINLIDVCYDKHRSSSIYARHIVQGGAIRNAMKSSVRPTSFKTVEIPANIDVPKFYMRAYQQKRFEEIFGDKAKADAIMNKTYLTGGHLAPNDDFLFLSWQYTTYHYINTVPQWQTVNNGNWKAVEDAVRVKADQLGEDVIVFTGGHDVLTLHNEKISLGSDGLLVPKWSWKVVKHESSSSGIAFVTLNNPFATSEPQNLCEDICESSNWTWKGMKTFSKGYTICCEVDDLMKEITSVPSEARVARLLKND